MLCPCALAGTCRLDNCIWDNHIWNIYPYPGALAGACCQQRHHKALGFPLCFQTEVPQHAEFLLGNTQLGQPCYLWLLSFAGCTLPRRLEHKAKQCINTTNIGLGYFGLRVWVLGLMSWGFEVEFCLVCLALFGLLGLAWWAYQQLHVIACTCMHLHAPACICMQLHAFSCMQLQPPAHICLQMHTTACICTHLHANACNCMHMHTILCSCMQLHTIACNCIDLHAVAINCSHLHLPQEVYLLAAPCLKKLANMSQWGPIEANRSQWGPIGANRSQ